MKPILFAMLFFVLIPGCKEESENNMAFDSSSLNDRDQRIFRDAIAMAEQFDQDNGRHYSRSSISLLRGSASYVAYYDLPVTSYGRLIHKDDGTNVILVDADAIFSPLASGRLEGCMLHIMAHELGHVLGYGHSDGGLMFPSLKCVDNYGPRYVNGSPE